LLVAGTAIGSGMIALPMVLAKLGIIPSLIIMLAVWVASYKSALLSVELNLQAKTGLPLGALAGKFSGPRAEIIGTISLNLLLYSLLAVYIYGMASIAQKLTSVYWNLDVSSFSTASCVAVLTAALLLLPIRLIDYMNRIVFSGLIAIFLILLCAIVASVDTSRLPLMITPSFSNLSSVLSVVFTSFGFQVIFHTLANYCGLDARALKKTFFYGSLIPAIVYVAWTYGVLGVLYGSNEAFYMQMSLGQKDVGDLIKELSSISNLPNMQLLVWALSVLAVFTSILGVGAAIVSSLDLMLKDKIISKSVRKIACSLLAVVPSYVVATAIPNAFVKIFGFAGAILSIIAIFMPLYLLYAANIKKLYYKELSNKWLLALFLIFGIIIATSEL
jgi:tyrosine-specific transport protein